MSIKSLGQSCFEQIQISPEFSRAYLKTLKNNGYILQHAFSRLEIELDKLTDPEAQELALHVCQKLGDIK